MKRPRSCNAGTAGTAQRGTVLLFALITLTILLISAVALVRSFNGTMVNAGNVAFKRDLLNQGEQVWPIVNALMTSGALASTAARGANLPGSNYSAVALPSVGARGIPNALYDDSTFTVTNGFNTALDIQVPSQGVSIRYVIDRMCSSPGTDATLGASQCVLADSGSPTGDSSSNIPNFIAPPQQAVYRLSIRVTGPRNTQAFYQTTFSL